MILVAKWEFTDNTNNKGLDKDEIDSNNINYTNENEYEFSKEYEHNTQTINTLREGTIACNTATITRIIVITNPKQ